MKLGDVKVTDAIARFQNGLDFSVFYPCCWDNDVFFCEFHRKSEF